MIQMIYNIFFACSAGAGRTGTILAIHAMMELADNTKQVDIYNFTFSMRNNRPHMVQTSVSTTLLSSYC